LIAAVSETVLSRRTAGGLDNSKQLAKLKRVIAQIHYGSKVANEKDRLIIEAMLEDWISDAALQSKQ
jgi:hypothetical protein